MEISFLPRPHTRGEYIPPPPHSPGARWEDPHTSGEYITQVDMHFLNRSGSPPQDVGNILHQFIRIF